MLSREILHDDRFTDLSATSKLLYVYLNLEADDDGFFTSTKQAMFSADATKDDLQNLIDAGYVLKFDSGVYVIRHWKLMNTIQKDRYKPTNHVEELMLLNPLEDSNKVYEFRRIQNVSSLDTQSNQIQQNQFNQFNKPNVNENNLGKTNVDEADAPKKDGFDTDLLRAFIDNPLLKKAKKYFTDSGGLLRKIEEYEMFKELFEDYGYDDLLIAIDICKQKEGKTVQYLSKVCSSNLDS